MSYKIRTELCSLKQTAAKVYFSFTVVIFFSTSSPSTYRTMWLSEPWKKFGSATHQNKPQPGGSLFVTLWNRKVHCTLLSLNYRTVRTISAYLESPVSQTVIHFSEIQSSIVGYLFGLFSEAGLVDIMVWWAHLKIVALEHLPWPYMMDGLLTWMWRTRKKKKRHCCRNQENN